jgi:hypothetical protein
MANFEELNTNILLSIQMILANQNLCKYLYYADSNPISQTTISDTSILLMNNLYPLPKIPNAETGKISIVNVYFPSLKTGKKNPGFRKDVLCFDVMCHLDTWMIDEGIRPYSICREIDKMFNDKQISALSINRVYFDSANIRQYSDYFYGYYMVYELTNPSNVGCAI